MGVIIENGRGGWWNPMILILSISINIWSTRYVLQTCYVYEDRHFLTYSANSKTLIFFLIFMYIFNASKFLRARWLYDITVTSYEIQWYSFWYQWIEEVIPIRVCRKTPFPQFETPGELSLGMDTKQPKISVKSKHVSPRQEISIQSLCW